MGPTLVALCGPSRSRDRGHGEAESDGGGLRWRARRNSAPAAAPRRLGVLTIVAIEAMFEQRPPRVRLIDGTLGIPAHGYRPEVDIIWTAGDSSLP